ncbi:MAG: hypothetical protein DHS20C01_34440 [marine bacterium B5-7]|nr:MAG: hypothetical protein DHS20C01_34440 [marine bacterium B5-7]
MNTNSKNETDTDNDESGSEDSESSLSFEPCRQKHNFCTVGLGECKMRKGHEDWGQGHVCGKCNKDF